MLKFTGAELEKIHNIDIHLFLEKGLRDGVSYISKKHSIRDENTDIMYWDMNNLYGTVMSFEYLPYGDLTRKYIKKLFTNPISFHKK